MSVYRRIICAVDLSPQRIEVLRRALRFAGQSGALLVVACVIEHDPLYGDDAYPVLTPEETRRQILKHAHDQLSRELAELSDTSVEIQVAIGKPRATLMELATAKDILEVKKIMSRPSGTVTRPAAIGRNFLMGWF